MKYTAVLTISAMFVLTIAAPSVPRDALPTDADILNFALTLEHLENAFYNQGLANFSEQDFLGAGYESWARGRFEEIAGHEATHVTFLEAALGSIAVKPCTYNFPDTDPKSFVTLSHMLETVGTSAYTGAAQFLKKTDYITAAASILSTEARQSAWVNSAVRHGNPWSTAFEAPLSLNQVFTIASVLIKTCPPDNTPLPVKAFPTLALSPTTPGSSTTLSFTIPNGGASSALYAVFISGLTSTFVPLGGESGREVQVPNDLEGVVFVIVTNSADAVNDATTVAGPAMVSFDFDSEGHVEMLSL